MNGAESLVHTLLGSGVDTCFANPGTSEMHFVAALDRVPGMRCVLGAVRGRRDRRRRRLRAHGRASRRRRCCIAGPASPTASPTCTTPAARRADRQLRRRPGDLSPPARRAADRRHRGLGARRLGLGAHGASGPSEVGADCRRWRCRRRGRRRADRHADPAVRHVLGRGRRGCRRAAGAGGRARSPRWRWRPRAGCCAAASRPCCCSAARRCGRGRSPMRIASPPQPARG